MYTYLKHITTIVSRTHEYVTLNSHFMRKVSLVESQLCWPLFGVFVREGFLYKATQFPRTLHLRIPSNLHFIISEPYTFLRHITTRVSRTHEYYTSNVSYLSILKINTCMIDALYTALAGEGERERQFCCLWLELMVF